MKSGKPKLTRLDAERLFEGLPAGKASTATRPVNPFAPGAFGEHKSDPFEAVGRRPDDETRLWKDNLVTLPLAIELPAGYKSAAGVREAMERAWSVKWLREGRNEVVTDFPEGWKAVRPKSGPIELRDPSGVVRAVYGWAEDAELRILPRYAVESQANSTTGLNSVLIRDRESGQILERSAVWSARTGTDHPEWAKLTQWLVQRYPDHRDPLRYWSDCERNKQA